MANHARPSNTLRKLKLWFLPGVQLLTVASLTLPNLASPVQAAAPTISSAQTQSNAQPPAGSTPRTDLQNCRQAATQRPWYLTPEAQLAQALEGGPVMFIENVGQADARAKFVVRGEQGSIFLADDAI
jgi:hypothetical protein